MNTTNWKLLTTQEHSTDMTADYSILSVPYFISFAMDVHWRTKQKKYQTFLPRWRTKCPKLGMVSDREFHTILHFQTVDYSAPNSPHW